MAKRANPFVEDFIPQSKIHVGLKQFNNNEDRLKTVYEKTLELLFKGSKNLPAPDLLNNNDIHFNRKDKMKQLFIGKDGTLLHSGCVTRTKAISQQCSCGGALEAQCAYCEAVLCSSCQHGCERCEGTFCTRCILVRSEGCEVCVSCYG